MARKENEKLITAFSINEERKVRIVLSDRATHTMTDDMYAFDISSATVFINKVFANYKDASEASVSLRLKQRRKELNDLFSDTRLSESAKKIVIDRLLVAEEERLKNRVSELLAPKGPSKVYYISRTNIESIENNGDDAAIYNGRPGRYMRAVMEEYCSLPFIKREEIYRKEVYEEIERACIGKLELKIKGKLNGKDQWFRVYPYKIVPGMSHTQSYLVGYSRKEGEKVKDKIVASFSMARLDKEKIKEENKSFHLSKAEKAYLDDQIANNSTAYLVGKPEKIRVKLTEKGKEAYRTRLYSRPEKAEGSTEDVYVFYCTKLQIMNYFFSFGEDAEIISPEDLRERFKNTYAKALDNYS